MYCYSFFPCCCFLLIFVLFLKVPRPPRIAPVPPPAALPTPAGGLALPRSPPSPPPRRGPPARPRAARTLSRAPPSAGQRCATYMPRPCSIRARTSSRRSSAGMQRPSRPRACSTSSLGLLLSYVRLPLGTAEGAWRVRGPIARTGGAMPGKSPMIPAGMPQGTTRQTDTSLCSAALRVGAGFVVSGFGVVSFVTSVRLRATPDQCASWCAGGVCICFMERPGFLSMIQSMHWCY